MNDTTNDTTNNMTNDTPVKEIDEHFPKAFLARQGVTLAALQARLEVVGDDFVTTLDAVNEVAFYRPEPGKWSPAQLADHVVRAGGLFAYALKRACDGREVLVMPRGKVTEDGRAVAPGEEPAADRDRADLLRDFQAMLVRTEAAAERAAQADLLDTVCLDQSFFGPMTGLECLQLSVWHVRHHTKQLSNCNCPILEPDPAV